MGRRVVGKAVDERGESRCGSRCCMCGGGVAVAGRRWSGGGGDEFSQRKRKANRSAGREGRAERPDAGQKVQRSAHWHTQRDDSWVTRSTRLARSTGATTDGRASCSCLSVRIRLSFATPTVAALPLPLSSPSQFPFLLPPLHPPLGLPPHTRPLGAATRCPLRWSSDPTAASPPPLPPLRPALHALRVPQL